MGEPRQKPPRADAEATASTPLAVSRTESFRAPAGPGPGSRTSGRRYAVKKLLGGGTFGQVYLAYDGVLQREVALKIPRPERIAAAEDVEGFIREARNLAKLDHPGIVSVYDAERTSDGSCYIVSQFIQGTDLKSRLAAGPMPLAQAVAVVALAAEALDHAHHRGLVHRDIKPANILLDDRENPKVADFGLALAEEDFGRGTTFAGTLPYMSPEQARSESHRVDGRSDVFSLGVVFYELLTGVRPFQGKTQQELLDRITDDQPRPPRLLNADVPEELERVCLKCLAKRASERYQKAGGLAEDLRAFEARGREASKGAGKGKAPPPPVVPRGLRPFGREDAAAFLELLPGPRDRSGLPAPVRFWKDQVEETDPAKAFRVGLLLGPSGSGKSSLVRAGLLPRLGDSVRAVYVEATPTGTEASLIASLRRSFPDLPGDLGLRASVAALRRGRGVRRGRKALIVLDQFEQWLFAKNDAYEPELIQALRQCDGGKVQCLALVRDDFAMAATRFMREIEVPIIEGQNFAAVDLFEPGHARKVLTLLGRAYGRLPADVDAETHDQREFLDRSVTGLTRDGKVEPVQLSLFVETVKDRPWSVATLKQVGDVDGIGVAFLERNLGPRGPNPEYRRHAEAARAALATLLPVRGGDLKGQRRSAGELRSASGYAGEPAAFDALLRILDTELKLITPVDYGATGPAFDPAERETGADRVETVSHARPAASVVSASRESESPDEVYALAESYTPEEPAHSPAPGAPVADTRVYQLAHDYLVVPLRTWLSPESSGRRSDWARWRLETRAREWNARPQPRRLPSWWEWVHIRALTRRDRWGPGQRKMMRVADRFHAVRTVVAVVLLVAGGFAATRLGRSLHSTLDYDTVRTRADSLLVQLYASQLARAAGEIRAGRPAAASAVLDECPESTRHREWDDLKRLCLDLTGGKGRTANPETGEPADEGPFRRDGRHDARASGFYRAAGSQVRDRIHTTRDASATAGSPDHESLAQGTLTGKIFIWRANMRYDHLPLTFQGPKWEVLSLEFSPNGHALAVAGEGVAVFDAETGSWLWSDEPHGGWLRIVLYSADGTLLAAAGDGGVVRLYDATRGRLLFALHDPAPGFRGVGFSPDGRRLRSVSAGGTKFWDTATGVLAFDTSTPRAPDALPPDPSSVGTPPR